MGIKKNSKGTWDVYAYAPCKKHSKGRIQRRKVNVSSKSKAEKLFIELRVACLAEAQKLDGYGVLWFDLIDDWFNDMSGNQTKVGQDTLKDYHSALKNWTAPLKEIPADKISIKDLRPIFRQLKEAEGKSASFIQKMKHIISAVYRWADENQKVSGIEGSPAAAIKVSRKKEEKKPECLSTSEIKKLLTESKKSNHPWHYIWSLALATGCRSGELHALTWNDIDFEAKQISVSKSFNKRQKVVKETKAGYFRTVPINSDLYTLLKELEAIRGKEEHVLPRLKEWNHGYQARVLKSFCGHIGITKIKFHTLRACFATQLLQNGEAPIKVMMICGWKDMDTMARYVRLAGVDESGVTDCLNGLLSLSENPKTPPTQLVKNAKILPIATDSLQVANF